MHVRASHWCTRRTRPDPPIGVGEFISEMIGMNWYGTSKRNPVAAWLYSRHYSSLRNGKSIRDFLSAGICGPGESITLLTANSDALFVWLKSKYRQDGQEGVNCAVFRNESDVQSSLLIREAEQIAWARWPEQRLFTFVNPTLIRSNNPGYCFLMAGWQRLDRKTKKGLRILEKLPQRTS